MRLRRGTDHNDRCDHKKYIKLMLPRREDQPLEYYLFYLSREWSGLQEDR